jgi:tetratricopeptide (TPR) repeat protein
MNHTRRLLLAVFAAALTGCGRSPETQFRKGVEYYQQSDYAQAASCFEKALAKAPATAQAHTLLGVCRLHQGKPDAAIRCFREALKLDANYLAARYNLALAQLEQGQTDLAAAELRQLAALPGFPSEGHAHLATAYNNLAVTAARQRDVKRAELCLQLALAADPKSASATRNLAALKPSAVVPPRPTLPVTPPPTATVAVVTAPKPLPATPPVATQVVTAPPSIPVSTPSNRRVAIAPRQLKAGSRYSSKNLFNEAVKLHQQGKLPNAIALYARAVAADPTYAQAYYNLAIAYRDNRQTDLAFDNYELALMADPTFQSARYNYAILLQNQGYIADALEQYEKILQESPNDAAVHLTAAQLYVRDAASRAKARQHYEAYLKLAPTSPLARDIRAWLDQNR